MEGGLGVGHVLTMLLDAPTIVTILMLSLPILLWNGMWKDFVRGFRLLKKGYTCSLAEMKRTQDVVELMQKQIICAGIILMPFDIKQRLVPISIRVSISSSTQMTLYTSFGISIIYKFISIYFTINIDRNKYLDNHRPCLTICNI